MAKVVPLTSAKAFLHALEKSGLLTPENVATLRESREEDANPRLIARDLVREGALTKWQAGQLLHGFHQLVMGKYKLMDQLGAGEMGRLFLAEHAQLGRKVSLKILGRKYTSNPEILKKVLEDGRRAAALDHRNLSHVFDVNSDEDRYYLVTEYVEGKDLKKLVESSGATAPSQAIDIVRQAAEGLEHAHAQGVIHGDLKPSNLIIDSSGVVKILDLGLARVAATAPAGAGDETVEMATLSAQSFQAPEQRNRQEVSQQADLFSLGGILYYLLSGLPPLDCVKSLEDVTKVCPAASDELADLCARMLSEVPSSRPQTAREVIEGLDAASRAKPKPAAMESQKANGGKARGKQRKTLVAKPLEIPFPTSATAAVSLPIATDKSDQADLGALSRGQLAPLSEPAAETQHQESPDSPQGASEGDPFAGFAIQTKRKKQKTPAEAAVVPTAAAIASPEAEASPPIPKVGKTGPSLPVVIGVGVGGGVLILALGVTVLIWALFRGGDSKTKEQDAVAQAKAKENVAAAVEANPESNPEVNPEVNPQAPPASTTAKVSPKETETPKTPVPAATNPAAATNDSVKTAAKPTTPMPMPPGGTPTPAASPSPAPVTTTPMPPPMPKSEPDKPTPELVVPMGNPFEGFAKIVALPPLEEKGKPVADATKPLSLGTLKLPPKLLCLINLKGGENAIAGAGKQKFVLEAGNNGTAERDWEIKLSAEGATTSLIIARLAIQNDQLNFQWTDDATRQLAAAPYLCNCVLSMSAGTGSHQLGLRQPLTGEGMKVDLEKAMSAKYIIEYPPKPKQIVIQLGTPEGKFTKVNFEKPELTALKDTTIFKTGPSEEAYLLLFKLDCSMRGNLLRLDAAPHFQLHGMTRPEKYLKATLNKLAQQTQQDSVAAIATQQQITKNLAKIPEDRKAQAQAEAKKLVEDTDARQKQALLLKALVNDLQGQAKLHFRIYYEADSETKVDLLSTGALPAAASP